MFKGGYTIIDGDRLKFLFSHPSTSPIPIDKDLYHDVYNLLTDGKFNTIGITDAFAVVKSVKNFNIQLGVTDNIITFTVEFNETTDAKVTLTETIEQVDDEIINNYWGSVDFISSGGGGGGSLYCHSIRINTMYSLQVYSTSNTPWTYSDLEEYVRQATYGIPVAAEQSSKHFDDVDYQLVRACLMYSGSTFKCQEQYLGVAVEYNPEDEPIGYRIIEYTADVLFTSDVSIYDYVFEV